MRAVPASMPSPREARRYFVSGHVQGVGYRWFARTAALRIGLSGWTRNLSDGRVEVYAIGTRIQLNELKARLHLGPDQSEVTGVLEQEASLETLRGFRIERRGD